MKSHIISRIRKVAKLKNRRQAVEEMRNMNHMSTELMNKIKVTEKNYEELAKETEKIEDHHVKLKGKVSVDMFLELELFYNYFSKKR